MRIKSILTAGLALIAITLAGSPPTYADDFLWLGLNPAGGWTDQANWLNTTTFHYPDGYPHDARDNADFATPGRVEIKPDPAAGRCFVIVCNLKIRAGTSVVVLGCVTIGCKLTIEPGGSLIIQGGLVVLTADKEHEIGGLIILTNSTSRLRIKGNATFDPFTQGGGDPVYGYVKGQHNNATIEICEGKTLTNNITICGQMTIQSATCGTTGGSEPAGTQRRSSAQPSGPQQQGAIRHLPYDTYER